MLDLDPFLLARIKFAATITFHILFPTINIALAWVLLGFKLQYNRTQQACWLEAYLLWVKIFALTFALGVVSGITMSFQFGTNWPGFMQTVGNVAGPLLGFEVLSAFFLEATFLGIMLYGMQRVPNWLHTLATLVVALGVTLSAFWIISLNSWMQSPRGVYMQDGVAHVHSWLEVIFNPTLPHTLSHMLLACFITVGFLLAGVASWQILTNANVKSALKVQKVGIYLAVILLPLQMLVGHGAGQNAYRNQPAKVAAMEGLWETKKGIPAILFAMPDEKARKNHYELSVPKLSSLLLTRDWNGEVKGLNDFVGEHPPVAPVFWAFRVMIGMGLMMLALASFGAWRLLRRGKLATWTSGLFVLFTFSGWVATVSGWYAAEIGRQPYLVYGLLKTKAAVASVPPVSLGITTLAYLICYAVLTVAYMLTLFYLAGYKKKQLPVPVEQ